MHIYLLANIGDNFSFRFGNSVASDTVENTFDGEGLTDWVVQEAYLNYKIDTSTFLVAGETYGVLGIYDPYAVVKGLKNSYVNSITTRLDLGKVFENGLTADIGVYNGGDSDQYPYARFSYASDIKGVKTKLDVSYVNNMMQYNGTSWGADGVTNIDTNVAGYEIDFSLDMGRHTVDAFYLATDGIAISGSTSNEAKPEVMVLGVTSKLANNTQVRVAYERALHDNALSNDNYDADQIPGYHVNLALNYVKTKDVNYFVQYDYFAKNNNSPTIIHDQNILTAGAIFSF
ncbi:MAG: hypothetical protein VX335_01500 [Pseudomonadota bacterium]|nr:hypothetical protein [Pseudomonadota bacterium]